jgi:hypothetical protein
VRLTEKRLIQVPGVVTSLIKVTEAVTPQLAITATKAVLGTGISPSQETVTGMGQVGVGACAESVGEKKVHNTAIMLKKTR